MPYNEKLIPMKGIKMYPKAIWSDQLKQGMEIKLMGRDCIITDPVKEHGDGYLVYYAIIPSNAYGKITIPKYHKIEIINEHL